MAPVDAVAILRELGGKMKPAVEAKGVEFSLALPDDEVSVVGERTQLRRLFLILIDNAIKYTERGSIRVELVRGRGDVTVRVEDSGIGIEEDAVPHVFERFWRADKVRSRAEGGTGLGLAMAQQIAQRHGGRIEVESALGQGSVFTVVLSSARRAEDF